MFTKSQAGTGKEYFVLQGRLYGDNELHLQAAGTKGNRDYGWAETVGVSDEIAEFIENLAHTAKSLAGTGKGYVTIQVRPRRNVLHFQIANGAGNRDYGVAFDVPRSAVSEMWSWVAEQYFTRD